MLTGANRQFAGTSAQYVGTAAVWGSSFLFVNVAASGLSPAQVALGSDVFGAITLAVVMVVTKRRWPRTLAAWLQLMVLGIFNCVAPTFLFAWAAHSVPSSLESIYEAATPILTVLAGLVFIPNERLTPVKLVAFITAACAIVLVASPWMSPLGPTGAGFIWGQIACLGAAASYALGGTFTRMFLLRHELDGTTVAASQSVASAGVMLLTAPFTSLAPIHPTVPVVLAVLAMGILCAGFADLWYTNVIRAWGATVASSAAYFTPVGGVFLGAIVLGDHIHWYEIAGGIVVLLAVLMSEGALRLPRRKVVSRA